MYAPSTFSHPRYVGARVPPARTTQAPGVFAAERGASPPHSYVSNPVAQTLQSFHETVMLHTGHKDLQPATAYGPRPEEGQAVAPPGLVVPPVRNHHLMRELQNFHEKLQVNEQRRAERNAQRNALRGKDHGKTGRSKGKAEPHAGYAQPEHVYHGMNDTCGVCLPQFGRGECVYRIACNRVFHIDCYSSYKASRISSHEPIVCPNCRGPGLLRSRYRHRGSVDTPPLINLTIPLGGPNTLRGECVLVTTSGTSERGYVLRPCSCGHTSRATGSPVSCAQEHVFEDFAWWRSSGYLSGGGLASCAGEGHTLAGGMGRGCKLLGKSSVPVDSGSWINIIVDQTDK